MLSLSSLWILSPLVAQEVALDANTSPGNGATLTERKEVSPALPVNKQNKHEAKCSPFSIAVVDITHINENAIEMKSICDQADRLREDYQKEITALEKTLQEERKRLDGDEIALTAEGKESRERTFELKEKRLRQLARQRKNQWEQAFETAKGKFFHRFQVVVEQIAEELHVTMVITKSVVPYHAASCDITQRVLETLNTTAQPVVLHPSTADK
ncbi:MAG: OmpH family outer membrane protein [Holosporales bacterium]|nr:OmpH family outer membrane protein [Holosporales bacterium]